MHGLIPATVYEISAIVLAAVFGADFALTEASLSALLKDVEKMHAEFVDRAQANYEKVQGDIFTIEAKVKNERLAMEERVSEAKEGLSRLHAKQLTLNQRRILVSIKRFMPDKHRTFDQNKDRLMLIGELSGIVHSLKGWKSFVTGKQRNLLDGQDSSDHQQDSDWKADKPASDKSGKDISHK